mmetsp:Transcript_23832/g.74989  ORF Transcript_23832/g.74989 Transcript_23832/m.74989 type:complete len:207 (-) Transcript_23832:557-1177(-)
MRLRASSSSRSSHQSAPSAEPPELTASLRAVSASAKAFWALTDAACAADSAMPALLSAFVSLRVVASWWILAVRSGIGSCDSSWAFSAFARLRLTMPRVSSFAMRSFSAMASACSFSLASSSASASSACCLASAAFLRASDALFSASVARSSACLAASSACDARATTSELSPCDAFTSTCQSMRYLLIRYSVSEILRLKSMSISRR